MLLPLARNIKNAAYDSCCVYACFVAAALSCTPPHGVAWLTPLHLPSICELPDDCQQPGLRHCIAIDFYDAESSVANCKQRAWRGCGLGCGWGMPAPWSWVHEDCLQLFCYVCDLNKQSTFIHQH